MFFCFSLMGQENTVYYFTVPSTLKSYDLATRNHSGTDEISLTGLRFKVVQDLGDSYLITFLPWKTKAESDVSSRANEIRSLNKQYYKDGNVQKYFTIPKKQFHENTLKDKTPPKNSFTTGAITVPIKIRFGSKDKDGVRTRYFDFYGDVNLGMAIGYKFRPWKNQDMFFNFLGGIGITSVAVDSLTTKGYIKTSTKAAALTPSLSFVWEIKSFQIGLFAGIDYLSRELGDKWDYKDQVWLGIGLGYSIFKTPQTPKFQENLDRR